MLNLYYELLHPVNNRRCQNIILPGIYVLNNAPGYQVENIMGDIPDVADRIWMETDDIVRYSKDRTSWTRPVDMTEFTWIKLKAIPVETVL